jgi:hypothetical protein
MYVVAIRSSRGKPEALAAVLAHLLGMTAYEAAARVRTLGAGPGVVGAFAQRDLAAHAMAQLQARGFESWVLPPEAVVADAGRLRVRNFQLGEQALAVTSRRGQSAEVPYSAVDLLLKGARYAQHVESRMVSERKFSPTRAILTSGLMLHKTQKKLQQNVVEDRESFFHVYAPGHPPLVFPEGDLVYGSLGAALQPSSALNFAHVLAELRRRCPRARYDERLANRVGQAQLLGTLSPERHLDVAIALLVSELRQGGPQSLE